MAKTSFNRRALVGGGLAALAGAGALGWWRFAGPGAFDPEARTCNICDTTARFRGFARRQNAVCPNCKAKERHRLLMHYLEHETDVWTAKLDVLHFSPDAAQKAVFKSLPNLNYVTADYLRTDEDLQLDLTNLDQPDESWDVLIVYHILEHIPDDRAAMKEMLRVLRPGGRAFVQVPIEVGRKKNYEDPSITTDAGRSKAFGQKDHVRKYGSKGFMRRLKAAGFEVDPVDYISMLDPAVVEKYRMSASFKPPLDESIWVLTRPENPNSHSSRRRSGGPRRAEGPAEGGATKVPAGPESASGEKASRKK
ncbi:MAG: methyltransferase domain-containing protein [Nannocystaceae bacterium]|nr:class I SAM-dependent methyltransferase [bacterium]